MSLGRKIDAFLSIPTKLSKILEGVKKIMAQIDDLSAALTTIQEGVDSLQAKAEQLAADLEELQNSTPEAVDLSGVLAQAEAIRDDLSGLAVQPDADE